MLEKVVVKTFQTKSVNIVISLFLSYFKANNACKCEIVQSVFITMTSIRCLTLISSIGLYIVNNFICVKLIQFKINQSKIIRFFVSYTHCLFLTCYTRRLLDIVFYNIGHARLQLLRHCKEYQSCEKYVTVIKIF